MVLTNYDSFLFNKTGSKDNCLPGIDIRNQRNATTYYTCSTIFFKNFPNLEML